MKLGVLLDIVSRKNWITFGHPHVIEEVAVVAGKIYKW